MELIIGETVSVLKCSFFKKRRKILKGIIKFIKIEDSIDIVGEWTDCQISIELEDGNTIEIEETTTYGEWFPKYKILRDKKIIS